MDYDYSFQKSQAITCARMQHELKYHICEKQILNEQVEILCAQKDPAKFDVLYNRYYEQILVFIYQRVDCKDLAYDISAQVFFNALDNLKKYRYQKVPFSAWLYRIAINELNKFFRKNKLHRTVAIDSEHVNEILEEIQEEKEEEKDKRLIHALQYLSEEEMQLVEMRFFEKRKFKEISEILEMTESNAKAKLYKTLEKLKALIQIK